MNRRFRLICILLLIVGPGLLCLPPGASAQWIQDQAVTWSNFNFVNSVASSMSHVYFATTNGIARYNKLDNRWEEPLTGADGLQNETPRKIWVEQFDKRLYVETDISLYEYDLLFERWYPISSLPELENPARHISTPNTLLPEFDANYVGDDRFVDIHGRGWEIVDVVDDRSGRLWLGMWGFGAAVARTATGITNLLPYGLLQTRVGTMIMDDSVLWLSGPVYDDYRTGLTGFNTDENSFRYIESGLQPDFPRTDINCLATDSNRIYAGTPRGVYMIDRTSRFNREYLNEQRGLIDDNVLSILLQGNHLYLGTAAGLNMVDMATDSIYHVRTETFFNQQIYDIEADESSVWIASSVGAYRYTLSTDRLQRYSDPELVLSSRVFDIEVHGGAVWFASNDGLVRLDKATGDDEIYREVASQLDYRALAVTDGVVAVTSNFGFTLIYPDEDDYSSQEFSARDGLASNVVFSLLFDGDYLWVGTDRGLTRFYWNNPRRVR